MIKTTRVYQTASLLILCPPRSFSSVTCAMLGQHPEMYGFPELNLFLTDRLGGLLDLEEMMQQYIGQRVETYTAGLIRAVAELHFGTQTDATMQRAHSWLQQRRSWTTQQMFDDLLEQIAPHIGVEKSPRTSLSLQSLRRALDSSPSARFIHLTRHPMTAIRSLLTSRRHEAAPLVIPAWECEAFANFCAHLWCFSHEAILNAEASLPSGRLLRVKGEDLINRPDEHLMRIAHWLGIRDDAEAIEAMKHPEQSPYANPGPWANGGDQDPNFLHSPSLRPVESPVRMEFPDAWGLTPAYARRLEALAWRLGYTATVPCIR